MAKMTVHQVLTKINEIRKHTSPPGKGETVVRGIDQITAADALLLDLQEKLLDDYGDQLQSAAF